jgi:hypothetical protein
VTRSSSRKKRVVAKTSWKLPRVGQSWAKEPCKGKGGGGGYMFVGITPLPLGPELVEGNFVALLCAGWLAQPRSESTRGVGQHNKTMLTVWAGGCRPDRHMQKRRG